MYEGCALNIEMKRIVRLRDRYGKGAKPKAVSHLFPPPELEADAPSLLQGDSARSAAPGAASCGVALGCHNRIIMAPNFMPNLDH